MPADQNVLPHTAITTWSGFIYQGKVAIYHVLKLLQDPTACEEYVLQLDSLEDFAILNDSGVVESMHQVKATKSHHYNSYIRAFNLLAEKAENWRCGQAFFHLACEIVDETREQINASHAPVRVSIISTCPMKP